MGYGTKETPIVRVRLVEVRSGKTQHSYLTSVLDSQILRPYVVADLYRQRWRIESAFCTVKPRLNLSYVWTASLNEVQLQIWGTWLFYAILVDLGDAVAEELEILFEQISLEMIYRGMYNFMQLIKKNQLSTQLSILLNPKIGIQELSSDRENLEIGWFPLFLLKREVLNSFSSNLFEQIAPHFKLLLLQLRVILLIDQSVFSLTCDQ